jgi:AcrR family transcriptional regulator
MAVSDRKQREKERRRTEILQVAETFFYEKGFDNVTMDEIADAVEISKGSLYLSFRNKDALFFAIVAMKGQEYLEQLRESVKEPARGGEQLRRMIRCLVEFSKKNREYNDMACTYGPLIWARMDAHAEQALAENATEHNLWLHETIRLGIEDGSIRNDLDPMLLMFYLSLIPLSVVSPATPWKRSLEMVGLTYEALVDNFLAFIEPSIIPCESAGVQEKNRHPGGP